MAKVDAILENFRYCPIDGTRFYKNDIECPKCHAPRAPNLFAKSEHALKKKNEWQKLLYIKQDFPDNYVDEDKFLEEFKENVNLRAYKYLTLVQESGVISQQLTSIILFISIFMHFHQKVLSETFLFLTSLILTFFGYWIVAKSGTIQKTWVDFLKNGLLFMSSLLFLSPILKTLTRDISEDTIWALVTILFLTNILLHDYTSSNVSSLKKGTLSLNAAIFASVLLASRLELNSQVFVLMATAIQWFALFPMFRRHLKTQSMYYYNSLTIVMFIITSIILFSFSTAVGITYTISMLFLTFLCPFWLIWIQRYKSVLIGPWDEAIPRLRQAIDPDQI